MIAAARIPDDADPALDQEIADLWAVGFDSLDIAEALAREGHPLTEAEVCQRLADQRERRRASRENDHVR